MRTLVWSSKFKKDWKREKKGPYRETLEALVGPVLSSLSEDEELATRLCDHALTGNMKGLRDCHIRPDLVLIYQKVGDVNAGTLELARLGSHAELGI